MKLDKNTVLDLINSNTKKIFIYFYEAGCAGLKVDIKKDFEITSNLEELNLSSSPFKVYVEKKDKYKFDGATITRTIKKDHSGKEKARYIFSNKQIKDRCSCGTSFSFEKKKPKINLEKLKNLKYSFGR